MSSDDPTPPAVQPNHNSWTPERQQRFLEYLADTGSVAAAARAVGMARQSAYRWRRHPDAGAFASAWDAALADAGGRIESLALERLVDGEEEVIERDGVVIAVRRKPCDVRLLLFHLNRLEDRRTARAALQQAVVLRRMEQRDRQAGDAATRPDASLVSQQREELRQEMLRYSRE
ncbi:hypothetical protein [Sandarakinorhabdus sp.]|uniref:hypothetical protein n=1 Tax=Sandarakinorhabdus sp. TaxID=1916663 RepID=UPI00286DDAD2|nr:hypothetical protein [Sandarakinorhabdus sp.]